MIVPFRCVLMCSVNTLLYIIYILYFKLQVYKLEFITLQIVIEEIEYILYTLIHIRMRVT